MSRKSVVAALLVPLLVLGAGLAAFAMQHAQSAASAPPRWCVLFELGPKFDTTKLLREQAGFMEHVTAIQKLATDGALLVGGPLLENATSHVPTGGLWIVQAADEAAVKKLAATDPFVSGDLLKVASIRSFFAGTGAWLPKATEKPAENATGGQR